MDNLYNSEVLLLTKTYNLEDLRLWLWWYSEAIPFDHIVVYDNDSTVPIKSLCESFPKVEYHVVRGFPDQSRLYTEHVNNHSRARWCIPLDDDEILYIGDKYHHSVNEFLEAMDALEYKKVAVEWVYMLSENPMTERTETYLNTHTTRCTRLQFKTYHRYDARGAYIKTFVRTDQDVYYGMTEKIQPYHHVHNPLVRNGSSLAYFENGVSPTMHNRRKTFTFNENVFIGHYLYKSESEWKAKCKRNTASTRNKTLSKLSSVYGELHSIGNRSRFVPCTEIKDWMNQVLSETSKG